MIERAKAWGKKISYDLKHTCSLVKHSKGSVIAWAYTAASLMRSLTFI